MSQIEVIDVIMEELVNREKQIYNMYLTKLIAVNAEAGGHEDGFHYGGKAFSLKTSFELNQGNGNPLRPIHPNLVNDAIYLSDMKQRQISDFKKIRQAISNALDHCYSIQDVRNTLPDLFTQGVSSFSQVPRTDEVGCNLKGNDMLYKQFIKVVELSERYLINKMVF